MALNIPMPGNFGESFSRGINTGSTMFSRIMQPILEREKQKQLENHFKQQMELQKAQFARSGANADLTRQILQQQLLGLKNKNDPNYEINQYKALENLITGGQQAVPTQATPTQEVGQGMGVFSPQGLEEAQQGAPSSKQGGINLNLLRQHPMLRGFAKKHLGFDPLAPAPQTPEDKQAAALDLFKQKEAIKREGKGGDIPTNKVLTQNQTAIQAIDTVVPMLDDLINHPDKVYGISDFSPSKKASYEAKTGGMIDMLVAAQSLPQVKESVHLVEDQIRRRTGEPTDDYIERLKDFKKDLLVRRGKSQEVVKTRKVNTAELPPSEKYKDTDLVIVEGPNGEETMTYAEAKKLGAK